MKIAILGGAFNPPHLGHSIIARQVLEFTDISQVWLAPCWRHTFQKELAPSQHRLSMTQFLANGHVSVSDIEIKNQLPGDTIETLELAEKLAPGDQFSFIIGSDNLVSFKKWTSWEDLITRWKFWIFPRPGFDYHLEQYGLENPKYKFQLIQHPLLATSDISSTLIRNRLKAGYPIDYLLPEKVREYINKHKLYTLKFKEEK